MALGAKRQSAGSRDPGIVNKAAKIPYFDEDLVVRLFQIDPQSRNAVVNCRSDLFSKFLAGEPDFLLPFCPDCKTLSRPDMGKSKVSRCRRKRLNLLPGQGADTDVDDAKHPCNDIRDLSRLLPKDKDTPTGGFIAGRKAVCSKGVADVAQEHANEVMPDRLAFQEQLPVSHHNRISGNPGSRARICSHRLTCIGCRET